jgi:V/A-type H+-transporting ATPase subunit I
MIINVKKHLILGVKEEIDTFFERAQANGIIEFIAPRTKKGIEMPLEIQHLLSAMKILRKLPLKKPSVGGGDLPFADETAVRILGLKGEVERLSEEKRLLDSEILRIAPFGDFSIEDLDFLEETGKREIQFFCMKSDKSHAATFSDEVIYVSSSYDLDYFIAINKEARTYPDMIEMRIDRPLGELQTHLGFVKESLHQIEAELKGYAGHLEFLHEAFIERLNDHNLLTAKKEVAFPLENSLFAIEAWVPENKTNILYSIIDKMAVHCEQILVEEHDTVPTYLENKGVNAIGEDLVRIYDIPATTDRDPSGWVFWFFALFFSMIVADGGYGLIYLALCVYFKYKYPILKKSSRRFLKLATILSVGCVIWGVLTSSIFGLNIEAKPLLGKLSALEYLTEEKAKYHMEQKDDVYKFWTSKLPKLASAQTPEQFVAEGTMVKGGHIKEVVYDSFSRSILLEFSLIIGVIHISLSLLRTLWRHIAGIGWVAFLVGAYLYFPSILKATSLVHILGFVGKAEGAAIGLQLIYFGIGTAVILALIQKRFKGIGEVATVIPVFADVLSYLRLYALGLAGAIMAETFNEIGQNVGLFLGFLVILLGHGINIMLGLMAGMIHGLRLNFIEWYHHCFVGGGRLFRPLERLDAKEH